MRFIPEYLQAVYHLLFPNLCNGCGEELLSNEKIICFSCLSFMPKTKFHLVINNPMEQKFFGRLQVENATAMYYFNKGGSIQNLLHGLKYKNKQEIGLLLGKQFAKQIEDLPWLKDIDLLIPIPLSKQKLKARGFNQSECIARAMASHLNLPLDTQSVLRPKNTESQTNKSRVERFENVQDAFTITNPKLLERKHVLLLDDVITTGATLEECASAILKVPNTKVSIVTLAYAVE